MIKKVISGGQRGADLGGLLAAERLGIPTGGMAPKGYRTEVGPQPILGSRFGLIESDDAGYEKRTLENVVTANATLLLATKPASRGSALTIELCSRHKKALRVIPPNEHEVAGAARWIAGLGAAVLNVAGNRESVSPGITKASRDFLVRALSEAAAIPRVATIQRLSGDLFAGGHQVLLNPVNTTGTMGKGLAAQFKATYPLMFERYVAACSTGLVRGGAILQWQCPETGVVVVNVPTKIDWRQKSTMALVESGMRAVRQALLSVGAGSIGVPALGCGEGGLAWERVEPVITGWLLDVPGNITIYNPG